jgi:hypothetical protein
VCLRKQQHNEGRAQEGRQAGRQEGEDSLFSSFVVKTLHGLHIQAKRFESKKTSEDEGRHKKKSFLQF